MSGPARIRVEGAQAKQGGDVGPDFAVTRNRSVSHAVSVDPATMDVKAGMKRVAPGNGATAGKPHVRVREGEGRMSELLDHNPWRERLPAGCTARAGTNGRSGDRCQSTVLATRKP